MLQGKQGTLLLLHIYLSKKRARVLKKKPSPLPFEHKPFTAQLYLSVQKVYTTVLYTHRLNKSNASDWVDLFFP